MSDQVVEFAERLAGKERVTADELRMYRPVGRGLCEFSVDGRVFLMGSHDSRGGLDAEAKHVARSQARSASRFWDYEGNVAAFRAVRPARHDHLRRQTRVKTQLNRNTCVCFASLAAVEAILKAETGGEIDLSEQFANWLFMNFQGRDQCDDGLVTTLSARYLSLSGVCEEADSPYESLVDVLGHCDEPPPPQARARARFGIGEYTIIDRIGLLGPSIANPDYLEAILWQGFDVVFAIEAAFFQPDAEGIFDIKLDEFGNPVEADASHAMLLVGYDRTGAKPYFIFKNSFGDQVGHGGYWHVSYDYVREYALYGYFVERVRTDMPTPA